MPKPRKKIFGKGGLHFITSASFHRQEKLGAEKHRSLICQLLEELRNKYRFEIVGYVVMPAFIHIPTCVGIAPTKTLAKVANFLAKKRPQYRGVCDLRSPSLWAELLPALPIDEVWGIGSASAAKLAKLCVQAAADLAALDPDDARALMTVTGDRTVYELRGISCLPLELGERLWRDGFRYSKTGVMITELLPETIRQPTLWVELDREKREQAWRTMDRLNATLGRDTIRILGASKGCLLEAQGRASLASVDYSMG